MNNSFGSWLFISEIPILKINAMRIILFLALLLTTSLCAFAQQVNLSKQFKNLKPRNIGPAGMSGRVTAIDAVWTNPDHIF